MSNRWLVRNAWIPMAAWSVAAGLLTALILLLSGCYTVPKPPQVPPHYDEPLVQSLPAPQAEPQEGVYHMRQLADGRWRYEYRRDGKWTYHPCVRYEPQPGDWRIPWRHADTLETW